MNELSQPHLVLLGQLAREYEQKYKELEEICRSAQPEWVIQQLRLRGELTTDRFRAAQQALLTAIAPQTEGQEDLTLRAVTTLCRCFDEIRILFQMLLEYSRKPEE